MKRIVLNQPGRFEIQTAEIPHTGKGMALVRIGAVGICGSDMHLYRKGRIGDIQMAAPLVIGHECMGYLSRLADAGKIDAKSLVTHAFPASRADDAFRIVDAYEDGVLKAIIDMKDWK